MKTKVQKQEELKKGKELFGKSEILVFTDFSKVPAEDLRKFRRNLKEIGASLLIMKKRLLGVLLKEKGVDFNSKQFESSVGTVFSGVNLEGISAAIYKFFSALGDPKAKEANVKKILGGYDVKGKVTVEREKIVMIGQLPPREVLLAQLLGMIAAPIRSFLYVLKEKSKTQ